MPRRKKGRDKRKSDKVRQNVPKDLPVLNVIPFQRIGDPESAVSELGEGVLVGVAHHEQRTPFRTDRSLEDIIIVSRLFESKRIELGDVDLVQFEEQPERAVRRRRKKANPMRTIDFSELQHSRYYLNEYRQYEGRIYFAIRRGAWYITLADLLIRIGPFEAEITARTWAQRYLGRKYFQGEESGA